MHPRPLDAPCTSTCASSRPPVDTAALAGGGRIELEHLPDVLRPEPARPRPSAEGELRERLVGLLRDSRGNGSFAAETMHTSRMQVHRRMKRFGIDRSAFAK
jgi:transcriptional regulator of acetoin/glycerol metabolism